MIASAASFAEDLVLVDIDSGSGDLHENLSDECEAVYEALVLGTRDYIRKCGFRKVLIGLSGGIDSSLTAAIAVDAVGAENVTGVGMPGPFSSGPQRHRCSGHGREIWAFVSRWSSITPMYEQFHRTLQPVFARSASRMSPKKICNRACAA